MNSSMPMDEAADKRPIVPGTSIPFFREGGSGDMLSGNGKYLSDNVELAIVADDAAAPSTVAIKSCVWLMVRMVILETTNCGASVYLSSAQETLRSSSFLYRSAVESGPAESATATLLDRQRLMSMVEIRKSNALLEKEKCQTQVNVPRDWVRSEMEQRQIHINQIR